MGRRRTNIPACADSLLSVNTVVITIDRLIRAKPYKMVPIKRTDGFALSFIGLAYTNSKQTLRMKPEITTKIPCEKK